MALEEVRSTNGSSEAQTAVIGEGFGVSVRRAPIGVGRSPIHGWGVFALDDIAAGTLVEICPAVVIDAEHAEMVDATELWGLTFDWGDGCHALALGHGSLFNHSQSPSVYAELDHQAATIEFTALRNIATGEELTLRYVADDNDLWF